MARTQVDASQILDGSIANADIASDAAIAFSKLAPLSSANILVGNGSNVATAVAVSGDITLSNAGVVVVAKLGTTGTSVTINTAAAPATGQVLTATSATAANWQTPSSSISGSGTTGTLTKWTGSTALGDSIVTESSGKIGISTASPGALLSVATNAFQVDSAGNIVKINGVTTSYPASQGSADALMFNDGSGNISWHRILTDSSNVIVDDATSDVVWI